MTEGAGSTPPPGWYNDPGGAQALRWWDGETWSEHTQPAPQPQADQPRPAPAGAGTPSEPRQRPRRRSGLRMAAGIAATAIATLVIASIIIAATNGGRGAPVAAYTPAPSYEPTAAAPAGPCVTSACIVTSAEGLKGTVAKDNSVMTRVACVQSTVKQVVSGTYTVHCTATYSDGSVVRGIASVLSTGEVDWEPTGIISYGS